MSEETAYHEAGHVLMAVLLGAKVTHATIEPDRDDGPDRHGEVRIVWPQTNLRNKPFAEKLVLTALAGPVAEMIYSGEPLHPGFVAEWADDWHQAFAAAEPIMSDLQKRLAWLETRVSHVYLLLSQRYWPAVAALADELSAHETLEEEQIVAALEPWL